MEERGEGGIRGSKKDTATATMIHQDTDPNDRLHARRTEMEDTGTSVVVAGGGGNSNRHGWDPYHPEILRTKHFYGYSGSLTEPPCSEFVEWHVMDTPMLVSSGQLSQLRNLLFRYVDDGCKRTSTHHEGQVVRRPLRDGSAMSGGEHKLHRCTCRDFLGDLERQTLDRDKCSLEEEQEQLRESLERGFSIH